MKESKEQNRKARSQNRDAHPYPDSNNPNMVQEKLSETRNINIALDTLFYNNVD